MGRLTVSDNAIQVDPAKEDGPDEGADRLTTGAQFYLDGDQIIVALGRARSGDWLEATTRCSRSTLAASKAYLTSRWFNEHAAEFKGKKMEPFTFPDTDSGPRYAYVAEDVPLAIGDTAIVLHNVPVLTQPLGSAARDDVYGVIGVDGLDQFTSYTFDYRTMRFSASSE